MRTGILGSGFGIYGYLPALIECGAQVALLSRAQEKIESRIELGQIRDKIEYFDSEEDLIAQVNDIVIARNPESQSTLLRKLSNSLGFMFLEKPLGSSIIEHSHVLELIESKGINFSIAYLFKYTSWYRRTIEALEKGLSVQIDWEIPNVVDSWKLATESGSNIFSYYGIHFVEMFVEMGIEPRLITSQMTDSNLTLTCLQPEFCINLKVGSESRFILKISSDVILETRTPFGGGNSIGMADERIPFLIQYISNRELNALNSLELEKQVLKFRQYFNA